MAFGGVDIGKHIAVDAAMAIPIRTVLVPPIPPSLSPIPRQTTARIGTNKAAVAVFEMKLERKKQIKPDTARMTIGLQLPNGILSIAASAKPDPFIPNPMAKPPATIQMTLQLISCISFAVITPVTAKIAIGIIETVLVSIPVMSFGITHKRIVIMKVMITTHIRHPRCTSPSIFRWIVFCVKGKKYRIILHDNSIKTITSGAMNAIQCMKSIFMLRPAGSLRYLSAMRLGGVPIGVPIPPRLAAIGIDIVKAIRPLPLAGRAAKTGVRKVSIKAAVAVFEMNIEKSPVISRNPKRTFSLLFPKGLIRLRAKSVSSPDFEAAIAKINPARKSIIIGSAKDAMISFESSKSPTPSPLKTPKAFLDTVTHMIDMMLSEVAHAGIHSVSHDRVANTKIAMTRCCTMVNPSIPKALVGRFQTIVVTAIIASSCQTCFVSTWLLSALDFSSAMVLVV